jgi:hypothetical protein
VKPPPPIPDSHAITLHQRPPPPEPTPTPPPKPEADPPLSPSSDSNVPHVDPKLLSTHPALNDLYNSVSASHASATDLRIQFDSLSSAASASQAQLQSTLDDLRARKRDEDADRLDVKTRTKALEEGKRQAEAAKREADKKLKVSEGLRDAVLARIAVLTKQVDEATEKMKVQKGQMAKSREHVQTREKQVKEEMEGKQKRVAEMEETVTNEAGSVKELEELVRKEEDSLEQAKADALEALEMERRRQTAFSPFGVPQPRAVENDYYAQTPMPSIYGPPISTASIFDLPPQQAPVSLLRRRQQTDPVPPTTSYSSSSSALSPPLSNPIAPSHSFSTASNDVFGFDDFGPGIVPNNISRRYAPPPPTTSHHYDPFQTSIAQPSPHARPIPPSLQTSDFQPFTPPSSFPGSLPESEPGSPGLMSASFSTLLPRGLFHSLSHDGGMFSPDLDGAPDSPFTNAYHRASLAESDGDGEQPESRDGSNPIGDKKPKRQSPSEDDGLLFSADEEDSPRGDELQDQVFDLRRQPNARPASDVHLPASPRSVFSDDPRSLLLDPSSDENFSYPPPATESSSTQANGSSTAVTGLFSGLSDYDRSSPETKRNKLYARLQQHAKENSFDSQRATLPDVSKDADGEGDDDDAGKEEKKDEIAASKKDGGKKDDSPSHSKFSAKSWFTSSSSKAASHQEIPPSSSPSSTALTPVSSNPSSLHATSTSASSLVPSLNPDAKAFSFNGPTSASSSSSSSLFHRPVTRSTSNPTRHPAPPHSDLNVTSAPFIPVHSSSLLSSSARNSSESLLLPNGNNVSRSHESSSSPSFNAPSSSSAASPGTGSRFFSSLRAFAPSAAEREALTRALRNPSTTTTSAANHPNASNRSIDTFHSGTAGVDHHRDPPPPASSSPTQASYPYASGRMGTGGGSAKRPGMGLTGSSNGSTVANGSESDLSRAAWDSASVEEGSKRKSSFRYVCSPFFPFPYFFFSWEESRADLRSFSVLLFSTISRFFPFTRRTTNDNSSTSIDLTSSSSSASTSSRHLPPVSVSTLPPPTPNGTGLNGEWAPSWSERSRKRFSFLDEQQQHQGHASSRGREKEL